MKTNEKSKKIWLYFIEIILILLIILASIFAVQAWARYVTSKTGQTQAQVAKWNFQVKNANGQTVTEGPINFPITRTDGKYDVVQEGTLAPGTWGEFQIIVDTTGTEVSLVYDIEVGLQNCPKNLKFYKDSAHTQSMSKVGDVLQIHRYLQAQNASGVFTETVYWNWEFESGDDPAEIEKNDLQDSLDMELDTLRMSIAVTGVQVVDDSNEITNSITQFDTGLTLKNTMIALAGSSDNINYFKKAETAPNVENISYHTVSTANSKNPIYMWFDNSDGTIYYWSNAKRVYLNKTSHFMFDGLKNIISIDMSNIDTSEATSFYHMFDNCQNLINLDVSGFDTRNIKDMYRMFYCCVNLSIIKVGDNWTTENADTTNMFTSCLCQNVTTE